VALGCVLGALAEAYPELGVGQLASAEEDERAAPSPADRFRRFDAIARTLLRAAQHLPLLLIFDDLHWADASSVRLLRHLVETVDRDRIMVVVTRRSHPEPTGPAAELAGALARRGALRLDLRGLTAGDVTALAVATTGAAPDHDEAESLRDRTDGNPFFLVELLRLWGDRHSSQSRQGVVPAAVGDVIAARLAQLSTQCQHLLRLVTVLGADINVGLLARLAGLDHQRVLDGLEPAVDAGMLVESDGTLRFSHALLHDAVYAGIPPLRRQRQHADAARLLEDVNDSPSRLAGIAHHWHRGGPPHVAKAWGRRLKRPRTPPGSTPRRRQPTCSRWPWTARRGTQPRAGSSATTS